MMMRRDNRKRSVGGESCSSDVAICMVVVDSGGIMDWLLGTVRSLVFR